MGENNSISALAADTVRRYKTRNPFEIAKGERISVCYYDLGELNGMYIVIERLSFVALSDRLDERAARLVCAHEIGHHFLHREYAGACGFTDISLFSGGGRREHEANCFAAALLIPDSDFISAVRECGELSAVSAVLGEEPELVAQKSEMLRAAGVKLRQLDTDADFLRGKYRGKYRGKPTESE